MGSNYHGYVFTSISGKREQIINKALPGEVEKPFSPSRAIIFEFFTDDSCRKDRSLEKSSHPVCRYSTSYCFPSSALHCGKKDNKRFMMFTSLSFISGSIYVALLLTGGENVSCAVISQSCSEMRCSKQSFLLFSSLYILIYLISTSSTKK